jgi:protein SCO1/2
MAFTREKSTGTPRLALIAIALAGLLVLITGVFLAVAYREGPKGVAGGVLGSAIGGPFHLVDHNGKPFTEADLKGKWHLIFFGFTHCADTCPTTLSELSVALDQLGTGRDAVRIVFISVDPERDTPDVLKSYVSSFGAIVALTGTADEVKQAAKAYRVYYAKHPLAGGDYDMDHSAVIYVMDPEGHFATTLSPAAPAADLAARLKKLLS